MKQSKLCLLTMGLALLAVMSGSRAMAQTPPIEPSDFTAAFVGVDYFIIPEARNATPRTTPDGDGFRHLINLQYPGMTGVQAGFWYEDYTNKRERFDVASPDPLSTTPLVSQFNFYDKEKTYLYTYSTSTCREEPLLSTLTPAFEWVAYATSQGPSGFSQTAWTSWGGYIPGGPSTQQGYVSDVWLWQETPSTSLEVGVWQNSSQAPHYVLWRGRNGLTELQFTSFVSGQPDASVFNLPAACAE